MCGLLIETEGAEITSIRGDVDDVLSRGHICPKALGLKDLHEDPDRLRVPEKRVGDRWHPIGWDEAFDEVAERLARVQAEHGRDSVAFYQGNPTVHNYSGALFAQLFSKALGTRNRYSATSVDQLPHMLAALEMFGHQLLLPIPDIDRTSYFLILGANPMISNGSLMSAPDIKKRLAAIQERGGKIVVVDPRKTETARVADEHLFIRPRTDALFLAALLRTMLDEGLAQPGRLGAFLDGFSQLAPALAEFTPEAVAPVVGIEPDRIRTIAREFAAAPGAVCYGRVGVATQTFGGLACWLINVINIVTGNLDRPGGALFTRPAIDAVGLASYIGQRGHFDRGRSRVKGLPEFGGEYPVATLADEMETPGKGQVRALVTAAGNPALSAPNGPRLEKAFAKLDYMVSVDIYRNETTRHADIILPPTFALEKEHYDLIFHALAIRNTTKLSLPIFPKPDRARHDWQIFLALSQRLMGRKSPQAAVGARALAAGLTALGPTGVLDLGLRTGPHRRRGLSLAMLAKHPHGVDLGPLEPSLPGRLLTRTRTIPLAPRTFLADLTRLAAFLRDCPPVGESLELIGRRELRSNNSWMHNSERLIKGPERCTLRMHPADARRLDLPHGSPVEIASRVGSVTATLEVSEELMPGVVSLPHGWGHHRPGTSLGVAESRPGVSLNDVTDDSLRDELCGTTAFNGVPVQVRRAPGGEPAVARGAHEQG
jgi:anaerobic selenocysteine-containing dehydrogenase